MSEGNPVPKPSGWDDLHVTVKAALSAVPYIGGPLAEYFGAYWPSSLNRRLYDWQHTVADKLVILEARVEGLRPESLIKNEAFVSGLLHASRIAIQTHQREKREALRNAVLNIAVGRAPDEDLQAIFLSYVETLTPWHLRILKYYAAPTVHPTFPLSSSVTFLHVLEDAHPELRGRGDFSSLIVEGLRSRGLLYPGELDSSYADGAAPPAATDLGSQFMAFIKAPPELQP